MSTETVSLFLNPVAGRGRASAGEPCMTLHLYFARRYFVAFLGVLAIFAVMLILLDMVDQVRRTGDSDVGFWGDKMSASTFFVSLTVLSTNLSVSTKSWNNLRRFGGIG